MSTIQLISTFATPIILLIAVVGGFVLLRQRVDDLPAPEPEETPGALASDFAALLERQEALERRMAALQEDALRYLQRGEQTLRQAEKKKRQAIQGDEEEEEGPVGTQQALPFQQAEEETDEQWAARMIAQRGEIPI